MADPQSPSNPKWADVGVRTLSAVLLAPAVLIDIWYGGIWFEIFAAFLGILMAHEWTVIAHGRSTSQFALHALAALCAAFIPREAGAHVALGAILMIAAVAYAGVAFGPRAKSWWNYVGVPYVAFPVLALVVLRGNEHWGLHAIIWLVAIVWAADILAYFAGRLIGGPKLAPRISPKKTWAGLAGAITGSALASGIFASYLVPSIWPLVVLAGILAVVEQAGDMLESAFKRHYGVKDSGHLIPGHGGIMDRVDGLIAVVVVAGIVGYFRNPLEPAAGLFLW
ncbi:MAG: phosphatidate cytidylyltransferase [Proteobacteria bacterium]|nr:phosphatidate cytidylyltransferase [Pseudomonadota bacterium]